jgi:hypothetical protein
MLVRSTQQEESSFRTVTFRAPCDGVCHESATPLTSWAAIRTNSPVEPFLRLEVGPVIVAVVERFGGALGGPLNDEVDLCWRSVALDLLDVWCPRELAPAVLLDQRPVRVSVTRSPAGEDLRTARVCWAAPRTRGS